MDPISRGREQTHLLKHGFFASITAMAILVALAAPASAQDTPSRSWRTARRTTSIRSTSDAPRSTGRGRLVQGGRLAADGFNTIPGIYRATPRTAASPRSPKTTSDSTSSAQPLDERRRTSLVRRADRSRQEERHGVDPARQRQEADDHRQHGRRVQLLRLRHLDQHQRRGGLQGRARRGVQLR